MSTDVETSIIPAPAGPRPAGDSRFLPALDYSRGPSHSELGGWTPAGGGTSALTRYAAALEVTVPDLVPERFKSIPSPWARLLLFEHALFEKTHPAHGAIVGEWRGLLGLIALSDYLRIPVTAREVFLPSGGQKVLSDMRRLAPGHGLPAWERTAILYAAGSPVGATSPFTLVYTGMRGAPAIIPFVSGPRRRLTDPAPYLNGLGDATGLEFLGSWIATTLTALEQQASALDALVGNAGSESDVTRSGQIRRLFEDWLAEVGALRGASGRYSPSACPMLDSPLEHLFDAHPASVLRLLRPGKGPVEPELCELTLEADPNGRVVNPGSSGVLVRPNGEPVRGTLVLARGFGVTVADGRLPAGVDVTRQAAHVIPSGETWFEDVLVPVREAHPGAITLDAGDVHFLLPLKPAVLEHLTADQLRRFVTATGEPAVGVEVVLSLPVARGLCVQWRRRYDRGAIIEKANTPSLAVWPNFRDPAWTHYFYAARHAAASNRLDFQPLGASARRVASADGAMVWGETSEPVRAWQGTVGKSAGLLLVEEPPPCPAPAKRWRLSVDFGSTHTRAFFRAAGQMTQAVDITPRTVPLLGQTSDLPFRFFPAGREGLGETQELRTLLRLPAGLLARRPGDAAWLPADGIIYWQSLTGDANTDGLQADLKWHESASDVPAFRAYITQLFLSVLAEAFASGASVESLATAFPSVFPRHLRADHEREWSSLARGFGVEALPPVSESAALAAYLEHERGATMATNLLAIDIGGSTSDLAAWISGDLRANDSVRLAGDVLSRLVRTQEWARDAVAAAAGVLLNSEVVWHKAKPELNGLVFNALLRNVARSAPDGTTQPFASALCRGPGSPGEKIVAHAAYLYASVSFLMGMMVRGLGRTSDHFNLQFAGRGSQFLPWLEFLEPGASVDVPRHFFLAGLASAAPTITVKAPGSDAKQEVGRGLLAFDIAELPPPPSEHVTLVGETGFLLAGEPLDWRRQITIDTFAQVENPGDALPVGELTMITAFLQQFQEFQAGQAVARALRIKGTSITPEMRGRIVHRLFGASSAWKRARSANGHNGADRAMLEPVFIVEAKALLEHATDNARLFDDPLTGGQ